LGYGTRVLRLDNGDDDLRDKLDALDSEDLAVAFSYSQPVRLDGGGTYRPGPTAGGAVSLICRTWITSSACYPTEETTDVGMWQGGST
jgi:hypothetical protein